MNVRIYLLRRLNRYNNNMDKTNLDLSVKIWTDFYQRANSGYTSVLLKEANELCQCFGITKEDSRRGKQIAFERTGDKYVNSKK